MRIFIALILTCSFSTLFAQEDTTKVKATDSMLVQLSGVVVGGDELNPMPYTTIFDKTQRRGVVSDYYGYFSLVVLPGDTLWFSYYGYKKSTFIVPDTLTEDRYSIIHMLQMDTVNLPAVTVYPWPSKEDFARAFLAMDPYDDDIRRAQRQLSGESLAFAAAQIDTDASISHGYAMNQYYTQLYTNRQLPANNLFNPYAWAKLIQDWKAGKLARE